MHHETKTRRDWAKDIVTETPLRLSLISDSQTKILCVVEKKHFGKRPNYFPRLIKQNFQFTVSSLPFVYSYFHENDKN